MSRICALQRLEEVTRLGPTYAAQLMGMPYTTYAQFKNGTRAMKAQVQRHAQALCLLQAEQLQQLIKEHVRDGWQEE